VFNCRFNVGDPAQENMDTVLLLSEDSCYVAQYDQELEDIADIQQIQLGDITRIEFGQLESGPTLPSTATTTNTSTFNLPFLPGSGQRAKEGQQQQSPYCVRIWYRGSAVEGGDTGVSSNCCLTFRATGFRFFNNMPIQLDNDEERIESLKAVADAVAVAMESIGLVPDMWFGNLERRRTAAGSSLPVNDPNINDELNAGEARPGGKVRNAGVAAALSNVTSQISRFNPIGKLMRPPPSSSEIRFTDLQSSSSTGQLNDLDDDGPAGSQNFDRMAAIYCPTGADAPPSICVTSNTLGDSSQQRPLTTAELRRQRKISRSSENLSDNSHPIDNVLMPFAMLSQGLQSLGSNLVDNKLSRSCEQFMGLEKEPEVGRPAGNSPVNLPDTRLMRGAGNAACQSLVLNI
jgi:hypothetical protein